MDHNMLILLDYYNMHIQFLEKCCRPSGASSRRCRRSTRRTRPWCGISGNAHRPLPPWGHICWPSQTLPPASTSAMASWLPSWSPSSSQVWPHRPEPHERGNSLQCTEPVHCDVQEDHKWPWVLPALFPNFVSLYIRPTEPGCRCLCNVQLTAELIAIFLAGISLRCQFSCAFASPLPPPPPPPPPPFSLVCL